MDETWKPVVGYEGLYEVSDHGRVRSLPRRTTAGRLLKLTIRGKAGHLCVNLSNGVAKLRYVHALVLAAFVGPMPEGAEVRHFPDPDPANNRLDNLQYGTHEENMRDKTAHDTHPDRRGERHPMAKLTEDVITEMRRLSAQGFTQTEIAAAAGVQQSTVSRVLRGKRWAHLKT